MRFYIYCIWKLQKVTMFQKQVIKDNHSLPKIDANKIDEEITRLMKT